MTLDLDDFIDDTDGLSSDDLAGLSEDDRDRINEAIQRVFAGDNDDGDDETDDEEQDPIETPPIPEDGDASEEF
jgi:hypothetical protein